MAYASKRIPEIADSIVDIDNAMKWGFAWEMGPFETWDILGVADTLNRMEGEGIGVAGLGARDGRERPHLVLFLRRHDAHGLQPGLPRLRPHRSQRQEHHLGRHTALLRTLGRKRLGQSARHGRRRAAAGVPQQDERAGRRHLQGHAGRHRQAAWRRSRSGHRQRGAALLRRGQRAGHGALPHRAANGAKWKR